MAQLPIIELGNVLKAYTNADNKGKKLLEDLYGVRIFSQYIDITKRVTSFQDICDIEGVKPSDYRKAIDKLELIAKVLNQGWIPNYEDENEGKYYPYFRYNKNSGRFSSYGYHCNPVYSGVGSRLVFKSKELAEFATTLFIDIYNEYLKY